MRCTLLTIPDGSDFTIDNLPFGVFSTSDRTPRAGLAIGGNIVDLAALCDLELIQGTADIFNADSLNALIGQGKGTTNGIRHQVRGWLVDPESVLKQHPRALVEQRDATMHLPIQVGDYTDFYSSMEHATNVGRLYRDPEQALLPNWKHMPVAYHGRSSSIVVDGHPIHRPQGQSMDSGGSKPLFGPSRYLDFELELGFVMGRDSCQGNAVSVSEAHDYVFGVVLLNDWSARDIQKWEYAPLGPFLGKNFATSISPWIVPLEALAPFRTKGPVQIPSVLPYLSITGKQNFDINLSVGIATRDTDEQRIVSTNSKYLYWNIAQQIAHHTVNGCNLRVGDILATGTISGPDRDSWGSLLEMTYGGREEIEVGTLKRSFLCDGDEVILRGFSGKDGIRVGFGSLRNRIYAQNESRDKPD